MFELEHGIQIENCGPRLWLSKTNLLTALAASLALISTAPVAAQPDPSINGARILRQVEPSQTVRPNVKRRKDIVVDEPSAISGPQIEVSGFRFSGNTFFSDEQLGAVLRSFSGRKLSIAELSYVADLIGKYYQDHGILARAVVPVQDVADGFVAVEVVESKLDGVELDSNAPATDSDNERAYVQAGSKVGDVLDLRRVERGTLLLNRLPGQNVRTVLRAGSREGTTTVVLVPEPSDVHRFAVSVDRSGSSRAGFERVTANATLFPIARFGDALSVTALASRGVQYGRLGYALPVGSNGLSVLISGSGLRYKLLNTPLSLSGNSETASIGAKYPIVLQSDRSVTLSVETNYRRFSDRIETLRTNRSVIFGSIGLDFMTSDALLGGGSNAFGATVSTGKTLKKDSYTTLLAYVTRRQSLSARDSVELRLSGQIGSAKVDPSQMWMINGSNGVYAFGNDEDVSGRSGFVGRATYERALANRLSASVFYDFGRVYDGDPTRPKTLKGAGLGAAWQTPWGLALDASVARAISAPTQFNAKTRAWISAKIAF